MTSPPRHPLGEQPGATALFTLPPPGSDFLSSEQQDQEEGQGQEQKQQQEQEQADEDERGDVVGHKRQRVSTSGKEPPLPTLPPLPPSHQPHDISGKSDNSATTFSSPSSPSSSSAFEGYRYFLLLQTGPNSSNNDCLFLGGWEMYVCNYYTI